MKRVDHNQNLIVKRFRQLGASVLIISNLGKGAPDIAVGIFGKTYFFEIKDGKKPPSARKLTEREKEFHEIWKGHLEIISSEDEVINFIKDVGRKNDYKPLLQERSVCID